MKKLLLVGLSGVLLSVMAGCTQGSAEQPVTEETTSSTAQVKVATVQEVVDIYEKEHPKTDITSIELEKKLKGFVYSVEGVDDEREYELEINAETKEIKRNKKEKLDRDEKGGIKREADKLDLTDVSSLDEATEMAEQEVGTGNATEWDLDRDLNVTYWEVQVKDGRKETQIKLDAKTGEVLEVELDD